MPIKNIDLALKIRRKPKSKKARQSERALGAGVEGRPEAARRPGTPSKAPQAATAGSSRGRGAPWSAPSISAIPAPASKRGPASAAAGFRAASRKKGEARAACRRR
ncbi:MAG: hypothetical protein LBU32_16015 [Clostridiales bacterium]|nr:hypothetical protein [Clostridiales bacterium]